MCDIWRLAGNRLNVWLETGYFLSSVWKQYNFEEICQFNLSLPSLSIGAGEKEEHKAGGGNDAWGAHGDLKHWYEYLDKT